MNITVQAIKDGEIIETRTWTEGRYTIGRNEICDMWLDDSYISTTHAELEVGKHKVIVHDMHSKNGIYYNNEKIERKRSFTKDFEVELGPYLVKSNFQKAKKPTFHQSTGFQKRFFSNIRVLLTTSLILMVVLASVTVFILMNDQTRSFKAEELRKRGNLFSLYLAKLAETDEDSIILDAEDKVLINNIAGEEGVISAVIADSSGQILAPQGVNAKKISWKGFDNAIREKERKSEDLEKHQQIIFYPIKNTDKVLGGAVIQLDMRKAGQSGMGVYFLMILVILVCICLLLGRYITRFFLAPLNLLAEEVSVAMKTKRQGVNFHSPHTEIAELVEMFNRLLQNFGGDRVKTESTAQKDSDADLNASNDNHGSYEKRSKPKKDRNDTPSLKTEAEPVREIKAASSSDSPSRNNQAEKNGDDSGKSQLAVNSEQFSEPQCQIDVNTFMIINCNETFKQHFCKTGAAEQLNFAEVFENPLISNTVYELLVGPKNEISVTINDTCAYLIEKKGSDVKEGLATIRFKESGHEQ